MCNCSGSSCGCSTVKGMRGQRGEQGIPGNPGENAQMLFGDGAPSAAPPIVTAAASYEDTATGGNWWQWNITLAIWVDTGAPVSGTDGVDGRNSFTVTTSGSPIPGDGGFLLLSVPDSTLSATSPDGGSAWMVAAQIVYIENAGYYRFLNPVGTTQVALLNLRNAATGAYLTNAVADVSPTAIPSGSKISPGGLQGPAGIPVEMTSGAPDPTVDPPGGASGFYVQTGTGGTYWYFDGSAGGPWTDTLQSVTGPAGPAGGSGANGYSPLPTSGTLAPSGGNDGDFYFRQVNPGLLQLYTRAAGVWVAGITVVANRLIGYSEVSATPNPGSLPVNVGDYYWSYVSGRLIFSVCSVAGTPGTWVTAIDILMTGGSGAPVDAEYVVAVSNATLSNERVANSTATIVPDTTVAGQMRWNIPDDGVTNAKLNNVPSNTFKGLGLGGPANPIDMTANQASTVLDTATDPFVRTSAIPGGTSTFQSISDGSPVLGDGRQTGTNVWTMQRAIQYVPNAQSSAGTGTTLTFQTDEYEQHDLTLTHDSVTLAYDPPVHDTANFLFSINNTTGGELSFLYSAGTWQANEGVTVPYTLLGGARVALIGHYYNSFMVITAVIQNTTTL